MNFTELLFQTGAVKVCPADQPFWYTSGMLGPYYVNTHFLYGNETKAKTLLATIDELKDHPDTCANRLLAVLMENYHADAIFKNTIDGMIEILTARYPATTIDYISGGERRDWIFSLPIARLLNIPHITMFKDLSCTVLASEPQSCEAANNSSPTDNSAFSSQLSANPPLPENRQPLTVIHIADLLNTASSYERAWLPILAKSGARLTASLVVVDRNQGGGAFMANNGIDNIACVTIAQDFFQKAETAGHISVAQLQMIIDYIADPKQYMKEFLARHPEYISTAKNRALTETVLLQ